MTTEWNSIQPVLDKTGDAEKQFSSLRWQGGEQNDWKVGPEK